MRRLGVVALLAVAAIAAPSCGSGSGSTRTVLADFNHDEFATSIFGFFPRITEVHPGDKIVFKQAWTGEAHTVTFGTLLKSVSDIVRPFYLGEKEAPRDEEPPGLEEASAAIPFWFGEKGVNQTAGQPCYLKEGALPADEKPCPRIAQPRFTGTEPFYSSGFIPYEGNDGNRYEMTLSSRIAAGDYFYYCLLHGAGMGGYLRVKPANQKIVSGSELNRKARAELDEITKALTKANRDSLAGKPDIPPNAPKYDILAGGFGQAGIASGAVDQYYPKQFTAKVGQKVTWLLMGHTVSFKVPKYGPQVRIDPKTHEVVLNEQAYNAVGVTIPSATEGEGDTEQYSPAVDAGSYDGSKFISSGVQFGLPFSMTFTKPGTYQYACTIHPRQVGTLIVKG
jgi:plastocyanin